MKNLQVLKNRMFALASILCAKMSHVVFFPHDIHGVPPGTLDTHWISWGKHYCFIKSSILPPCVSPSAMGHYQIRPTSAPPCMGPYSNNAHGINLYPTHKAPGIVDVPKMQCQTWLWPLPRSLVWWTPWKVFVTHGFTLHFSCLHFSCFSCRKLLLLNSGILDCRVQCCSALPPFMWVSVFDNRFRNFGCSREKFRIGYCERWSE
jgi:hypothetical protein